MLPGRGAREDRRTAAPLKAIFPVAVTDDLYGAVWHHGLLNSSFISAWLPAVGVMAVKSNAFWRGARIDIARHITASTYRRTPLFLSHRFRRCFVERLEERVAEFRIPEILRFFVWH